jgi:hypothetical protein
VADAVITTASASLGATGLKSLMTLLADEFIKAARNRGRIVKYVNTQAASRAVAQFGDTARIILAPDTASAPLLTDGNDLVLDDNPGTSVDVVLNKHRTAAFGYTQIAQALDGGHVLPAEIQSRMAALMNGIESDVCAAVSSGFTTNVVGSYGSNITEANVVIAMGKLFDAGVPEGDPLWAFVSSKPTAWQALVQVARFSEWQVTGRESPLVSANYANGTFWHGATWLMSQNVAYTDVTTDTNDNFIFHRDALAVALRPLPIPESPAVQAANFLDQESGIEFQILKQWNTKKLAEEIVIHALYGVSAAKESYGCLLKS